VLKSLIKAVSLSALLFASTLNAIYVYEADQSLFNLVNEQNTTNMAVGDDQVSSAFTLDFTFTFYGEDFTTARMATNGCLHFGSSGGYCNDYTPDPLPEITYTLYPFWTDLIRDNGSKVLAKNFTDKSVFGWYNLREYNRSNTDNSFEVVLWKADDSFEFRYGGLNIINHDVLIGEQGAADELYTYLFHDECSTGTTNVAGTCVNTNWNATASNTLLENGGSLYGLGSGNALDCSNPLNNTACAGYAAAYLTQQCDLDGLYSTQCPNYWDDLFDYECTLDSQHSPACPGYVVEYEIYNAYEDMYGYEDDYDQYGYEDESTYFADGSYYEDEFFQEDYYYEGVDSFLDEPWEVETYFEEEEYFEPFFEEEYFEPFFEEPVFVEELEAFLEEEALVFDYVEEVFIFEEFYEEDLLFVDYDLPEIDTVLLDHFEHEELIEEFFEEEAVEFLEFETIEELEEWVEQEEAENIAALSEDEDGELEDTEAVEEESEDREEAVEIAVAENETKKDNKKAEQLNVVANTIRAATNSVSGTTSGTSAQATGTSASSGGSYGGSTSVSSSQATAVVSSVSGGSISTNNSPSISAQVASSAAQTQQILSMSAADAGSSSFSGSGTMDTETTTTDQGPGTTDTMTSTADASVSVDLMPTVGGTQTTGTDAQVQDMQGQIDTAVSGGMTASEADQIADQIVAQNIQNQQEELEQEQQETGEYGDSSQLVAYMGYVPGFSAYRQVTLADASEWYEPKAIYGNVSIPDNTSAFVGLYGESLTGMKNLMDMQPKL